MRPKILYPLGIVALLACSCTKEDAYLQPSPKKNMPPTHESLSNAIGLAERLMNEGNNETRSANRVIKSVEPIGVLNRSDDAGIWYVVNYADNKGYCIVTDYDMPTPVAAFSSKGNLILEGIDPDSALGLWIEDLKLLGSNAFNNKTEISETPENPNPNSNPTRGIWDLEPNPGNPRGEQIIIVTPPLIDEYIAQ